MLIYSVILVKSKDADHALTMGAQGIGLYRTEFLYMENDELPTEDVQFEQYKQVAESMKGQPIYHSVPWISVVTRN